VHPALGADVLPQLAGVPELLTREAAAPVAAGERAPEGLLVALALLRHLAVDSLSHRYLTVIS